MHPDYNKAFSELLKTVAALRDPNSGCPWDLKQTHQSLLPFLIEETQEFMSVVEKNEVQHFQEELGDLLFQVLLHTQLAHEKKLFNVHQLCEALNRKLISRHPHVFEKQNEKMTAEEVYVNWNKNKIKNKGLEKLEEAMKLPPLLSAHKIGTFSQTVGFDWENVMQVFDKVKEEVDEVQQALKNLAEDKEAVIQEIGDLLFSVVQLARHLNVNADYCLIKANQKFYSRFMEMMNILRIENKELSAMNLAEKEIVWQKVKKKMQ